jgi:hypothetical protein
MGRRWKNYKRHPISARYPDIKGQAWKDFVDSVTARSVRRRPITMYEGKILDGWQLQRACIKKNIEPRYITLPKDLSPEEFVDQANDHRRHETLEVIEERREKRIARVAELRGEGQSTRAIAEELGISQPQVLKDLEKAGDNQLSPETNLPSDADETETIPPVITGQDGKTYRAKRPSKARKTASEKNGAIKYDWKDFKSKLGALVRHVDLFGKQFDCKDCPAANELRRDLETWKNKFRKFAEFQSKVTLPKDF